MPAGTGNLPYLDSIDGFSGSRISFLFVIPAAFGVRINTYCAPAGLRRYCGAGCVSQNAWDLSVFQSIDDFKKIQFLLFI